MKRNLTKRVFAAAALAVIAAAVSSCGSNNNNGAAAAVPCVPGQICTNAALGGATVNTGAGGCTVSFAGQGYFDQTNGINGQFGITGMTSGLVTNPTPGYTAGRINSVDGSMLEIAYSGSGNGPYLTVTGILSMAADEAGAGCQGNIQEVTLYSVLASAQALNQPFAQTLSGGQVLLNGNYPVYSW